MIKLQDLNSDNIYKIFDLLNVSIYWKDLEGRYLGCNKYMLDLLNIANRTEIIGKNDYDFLCKNDADRITEIDRLVIKEGRYDGEEFGELIYRRKIYFTSKTQLVDDSGNVVGIFGSSMDITDTKRQLFDNSYNITGILGSLMGVTDTERLIELEKQHAAFYEEAKIRQLIDLLHVCVFWKDLEGRFLGCNKYVLDMMGFTSRKELIGKTDYDISPKEEADEIIKLDKYVMEHGQYNGEYGFSVKGIKRTFLTARGRLVDSQNNIVGVIGTSLDITAQKEVERLELENELLKFENKVYQVRAEQKEFRKVVSQVVHDIQSPLSSLKTIVQFTTNMAEKERISVREAITSISDITNHMLSVHNNPSAIDEQPQSLLVSASLLQILSDKRYEYKNLDIKFESNFKLDANFAFIQVEPSHFKRMISNLLNNAIDALENKVDGKVSVRLNQNNEWVIIAVSDNGKGMLAETVDKIKNNTPVTTYKGGHGIGLGQVHDTLQRNLGKFDIYSTINSGTRIILKFPKILVPDWVQEEIKLIKDDIIVILDDDPSIHGAWEARLKAVLETLPSIQIKHFTSGLDTIDFINGLSQTEQQNVCLLTDYELLKQDLTGIDVINQTGIKCSTLVTSHYANHEVRELASKARIKILPKELVFAISLVLDKKIEPGSKKVDMVWVDDARGFIDSIIRQHYSTLAIDTYYEPISFLEDVVQYPLNTKIILDLYYEYDGVHLPIDGFMLAEQLHKKGYSNLYLLSGEVIGQDLIPDYLTVILKNDIEALATLDNLAIINRIAYTATEL